MSNPSLLKKLLLKPGMRARFLNTPEGYIENLLPLPEGASIVEEGQADFIQLFVKNSVELAYWFPIAKEAIKYDGIFWICYPKKSSKIKSDLSRDEGWQLVFQSDLGGVSAIAIDETWSALRLRPLEKTGAYSQEAAAKIAAGESIGMGSKPKSERPPVIVPPDFEAALAQNPKAKAIFDNFAYTHRKEYVRWIEEAKKIETRNSRIEKAVARIAEGVKFS